MKNEEKIYYIHVIHLMPLQSNSEIFGLICKKYANCPSENTNHMVFAQRFKECINTIEAFDCPKSNASGNRTNSLVTHVSDAYPISQATGNNRRTQPPRSLPGPTEPTEFRNAKKQPYFKVRGRVSPLIKVNGETRSTLGWRVNDKSAYKWINEHGYWQYSNNPPNNPPNNRPMSRANAWRLYLKNTQIRRLPPDGGGQGARLSVDCPRGVRKDGRCKKKPGPKPRITKYRPRRPRMQT